MGDTWPISSHLWEGTDLALLWPGKEQTPPPIHQPLGKTLNQEENEASTLSIWSTDKAQLISQFS